MSHILIPLMAIAALFPSDIFVDVYGPDGEILTDNEIMVGTHLEFYIYSDAPAGEVQQFLGVDAADGFAGLGEFAGRGPDSIFDKAGTNAFAFPNAHPEFGHGFYMATGADSEAGDWFVLDYYALKPGTCDISYHKDILSSPQKLHEFTFEQVPNRDFNDDMFVDFVDYTYLSSRWLKSCGDPNTCDLIDLEPNGVIDPNDLILFSEYWMEFTN